MESDRYIILSNIIFDREKIAKIYRDSETHSRLWVCIVGEEDTPIDGDDAIALWRMFDTDPGWRES